MSLDIDLQIAVDSACPSEAQFERWVTAAIADRRAEAELSLRITDSAEVQELNRSYRQQDKPTNVLSFPADLPPELNIPLLGDIIISAEVVDCEAQQQGKLAEAHWAHMVVHGTLHLLGYDHIDDDEAEEMEALETEILTSMGYPAPYDQE
ncbi:putative rRNA maturation factor [Sinobacterium caligoides]|uniref:Endoribonuclease YbeY n=1 Tax=Sinobacterium caligoides TaxID=933926 RepID=A0A3N2DG16_9GAMM|nr:rRNA maturation RNase YbeY [Sinobacterium caligoides]ROR98732.1 putative rRNA maturation factor [Sinobacterium caligoides]